MRPDGIEFFNKAGKIRNSPKIDINLSTGRSFSYDVSGTQNVQRGSAILRLKGMNEATASFLTLYTQGADHV